MSEMLERVALAFTGLHITTVDGSLVDPVDVARAAIEAMRDPTLEMLIAAGYRNVPDVGEWMEVHDWPIMIQAALDGKQPD